MSFRNALNGVFAVYKPRGWTSREATDFVQHSLSKQLQADPTKPVRHKDKIKMGHGGTLDPLAEGVLVLGVGAACKTMQTYLHGGKEYQVYAQFGTATDSYDCEGTVTHVAPKDKHPTVKQLVAALDQFRGEIDQVPPIYSAISIQGKRAYNYARQGIPLPKPIEARKVRIDDLELIQYDVGGNALFRVSCGGGTYMRSLVHDLGLSLGCYAHMTGLKRTRQGPFTVEDCLALVDKGDDGRQHRRPVLLEDVQHKMSLMHVTN